MKILSQSESLAISGNGLNISWGTALVAIATGLITGGPVGAGIAVSGIVAAQGIDNLNDLFKNH